MQVQRIQDNNTNFQRNNAILKNTFERQIYIAKADHFEAKARLHNIKHIKAVNELEKFENPHSPFSSVKETWQFIKTASSMTYHKLKSAYYCGESYHNRHKFDANKLS